MKWGFFIKSFTFVWGKREKNRYREIPRSNWAKKKNFQSHFSLLLYPRRLRRHESPRENSHVEMERSRLSEKNASTTFSTIAGFEGSWVRHWDPYRRACFAFRNPTIRSAGSANRKTSERRKGHGKGRGKIVWWYHEVERSNRVDCHVPKLMCNGAFRYFPTWSYPPFYFFYFYTFLRDLR